jgi:hypothetical protein
MGCELINLETGKVLSRGFEKDPDAEIDYGMRWGAADWVTATDYDPNAFVRDPVDGHYYRALDGHTSGATRLDDQLEWSSKLPRFYLRPGESIASHVIVITPKSAEADATPLIVHAVKSSFEFSDGQGVTIWFDDGTAGRRYDVTVRITTDADRVDDRTFTVRVKDL